MNFNVNEPLTLLLAGYFSVVVILLYSSIFLSTDTFIMSIGKHVNMYACVMIELKCKLNESKIN